MKFFQKFSFSLILILVFAGLAGVALAQLPLEGNYPKVPGIDVTITRASSLGEIVKYLTGWALIAASLVALLSLIAAGLMYLTSAGEPGRMQMGKQRITRSALGLLILLSSYIIFKVVDPKINITEIKTVPVASGIFLLADTPGTGDFEKLKTGAIDLGQMVKLQEARYLENDNRNLAKDLGRLQAANFEANNAGAWVLQSDKTTSKNKLINFQKFPVRGIAFWGDYGKMMKVTTYSQEDYNVQGGCQPVTYNYQNGAAVSGEKDLYIVDFKGLNAADDELANPTSFCGLATNISFFYQKPASSEKVEWPSKPKDLYSPPLSIKMTGNGPGVYLYSSKKQTDANTNTEYEEIQEKYFFTSKANFQDSDVDFNDIAKKILLKNRASLSDPADLHDYLVILHEDTNYEGQLRIYFESKDRQGWFYDATTKKSTWLTKKLNNLLPYFFTPPLPTAVATTVPLNEISLDNEISQAVATYGKVTDPSSLQLFELSPDPQVCVKVKLCTEPNFTGNCVVYNLAGKGFSGESDVVQQPEDTGNFGLPRYEPISLDKELKGMLNNAVKDVKIANNIRSISIDGDCVVALFEKKYTQGQTAEDTDVGGSVTGTVILSGESGKWDGDGPGSHSEIFTQSDSDLSDNRIGKCGVLDRIGFKQGSPCASAIAIYPIKVTK